MRGEAHLGGSSRLHAGSGEGGDEEGGYRVGGEDDGFAIPDDGESGRLRSVPEERGGDEQGEGAVAADTERVLSRGKGSLCCVAVSR